MPANLFRHAFRFTDGRWHVTPDLNVVQATYLLCTYGGFIQPQHEYAMVEAVEVEDLPLATCPTRAVSAATQPAPVLTSADLAAARNAAALHDSPKAKETLAQWAAKKAKGRLKWLCRKEVA